MNRRVVPQSRARRLLALAVVGGLAGCSLAYDFDRPAPEGLGGAADGAALDAARADMSLDAARPDLSPDAQRPDASRDAAQDDLGPDAHRPDAATDQGNPGDLGADLGPDAREPDADDAGPSLDAADEDQGGEAGPADAEVSLPEGGTPDLAPQGDAGPLPEPCNIEDELRLTPCHFGAQSGIGQEGATLGARRVEVCRGEAWRVTVDCAHAPPDVCAVACGGCPTAPSGHMAHPETELLSPQGSTEDIDLRYDASRALLPTSLPQAFMGWTARNLHRHDGTMNQIVRSFDERGRQARQESGPCSLIDGALSCPANGRRLDHWFPAMGDDPPFVVRRRLVIDEGEVVEERKGDLYVLTASEHRVVRAVWGVVPVGFTEAPDTFEEHPLRMTPLADGQSTYTYDDFQPAPSLLEEIQCTGVTNDHGQAGCRRAVLRTRYDRRMHPEAITRLASGANPAVGTIDWQRQLDTDCLDCGPQGCRPTPLITACDYIGFTHTPMGACLGPEGVGVSAAEAGALCADLLGGDGASPAQARLAVLRSDLDWERVMRRLLVPEALPADRNTTAWVDVGWGGNAWFWGDGRPVPDERLSEEMQNLEEPRLGVAVFLNPSTGLLEADRSAHTLRRALCAMEPPNPSLWPPPDEAGQ